MSNDFILLDNCGVILETTNSKFKLHNRKFFLTYKSHINKEELIEWFTTHLYDLKFFAVAHETSDDGYEHTHFLAHTNKLPDVADSRKFDYNGIHPNIRKVTTDKYWSNCFNYVNKQDTSVYTNITIGDLDKNVKTLQLIEKIQQCKTFKDVLRHNEIAYEVGLRLHWVRDIWNTRPMPTPKCSLTYRNMEQWQKDLYNKLKKPPVEREIIWCYSTTSKQGKSTFVKYLCNKFDVFLCNTYKLNDIGYLYNNQDIIIFDIPFAKSKVLEDKVKNYFEHNIIFNDTMLSVFETLSNKSQYTSGKYSGKTVVFNSHLLVMSNANPTDISKYLPNRLSVVEAKLSSINS